VTCRISPPNSSSSFEVSHHFWDHNFDDIHHTARYLWCYLQLMSITTGTSVLKLILLLPAKGEVFVLLYVFLFVCLFGQRFLSNLRADSRQSSHAGVLWFRMCLLPFWGLAAPGERKKGQMKNFRYYGSQWEIFAFLRFLSDISATLARIHTKYYLCRDNVCRRAPSPCGAHRPLGSGGRGS